MKLERLLSISLLLVNGIVSEPTTTNLENVTSVYNGGCAIVDEGLYQLGGTKDKDQLYVNNQVYRLPITQLLSNSSVDVWSKIPSSSKFETAINPAVLKERGNSTRIFILGGKTTSIDQFFKVFDSHSGYWYNNIAANENLEDELRRTFVPKLFGNSRLVNKVKLSDIMVVDPLLNFLTLNYFSNDKLVIYGSLQVYNSPTNRTIKLSTCIFIYNINTSTWKVIQTSLPPVFGGRTHTINGTLMLFGGINQLNLELFHLHKVRLFDLYTFKESVKIIKGDLPPPSSYFNSARFKNYIFTVSPKNTFNCIYRLNLNTLVWDKLLVPQLNIEGDVTCLTFYNQYLVIGLATNTTNSYVIDTINKKVIKGQLSTDIITTDFNYGMWIGLTVLVAVVGLSFFLGYFYYRSTKKQFSVANLSTNSSNPNDLQVYWNDHITNLSITDVEHSFKYQLFSLKGNESKASYHIDMDDTNLPNPWIESNLNRSSTLPNSPVQSSHKSTNLAHSSQHSNNNDITLVQGPTSNHENDIYFQKK